MNKTLLAAFCLSGLLSVCIPLLAADSVDSKIPSSDSTGPTNPTPPTLPTPGTGVDDAGESGIDGPDYAPAPGTEGLRRDGGTDSGSKGLPSGSGKTQGSSVDSGSGS